MYALLQVHTHMMQSVCLVTSRSPLHAAWDARTAVFWIQTRIHLDGRKPACICRGSVRKIQLRGNSQAHHIIILKHVILNSRFSYSNFVFKHIIKPFVSMKWKETIRESQYFVVLILSLCTAIRFCIFKVVCKH